jgi:tRNA modification GTPase
VITIDDTIAAIATPLGEGAIAVLRVSGPEAIAVVTRSFRSKTPIEKMASRRSYLGEIGDEVGVIDEVLVSVFRKPNSYTGQDLIEISCHGGILVTRKILALMLKNGARTAEPGEFTQRAFLNGRMDLTQAEAVMDLIRAQTDLALRAADWSVIGGEPEAGTPSGHGRSGKDPAAWVAHGHFWGTECWQVQSAQRSVGLR